MSILQNIHSLLSRKKKEEIPGSSAETLTGPKETPGSVSSPEPVNEPVSTVTPPPSDNVIHIYSHGFTNGVYGIEPDKDSFERFLEYCNQVDRIKEQRELTEKAIAGMELKLSVATAAYAEDTDTFIEKEKLAGNVSLSLAELEQRQVEKLQKESVLASQVKESISEYSWAPAWLYFAAGITFIVADISITKLITSHAFNMTGWQGWIFAIGLAFTAFLIKPTFDRLLEKPFQAAGLKLRKVYTCILLGITALGLAMLCCLGKFRSDSEVAKRETNAIIERMTDLKTDSPEYKALQAQYDVIQKSIDHNLMGQAGLILSGMLFAIGGAICLSIAFGSLKQLINRYWILPVRMRWIKKESERLSQQITALRSEHTAIRTEGEKAEKRLSASEILLLKEELRKMKEERSALVAELYQAQYKKEYALYLDGRNKGEKYLIEGKLLYKVSYNDQSSLYSGKQDTKVEGQPPTSTRAYTRRPFVKMRKMIADNFNRNQYDQTHDRSDFEIIS